MNDLGTVQMMGQMGLANQVRLSVRVRVRANPNPNPNPNPSPNPSPNPNPFSTQVLHRLELAEQPAVVAALDAIWEAANTDDRDKVRVRVRVRVR